MYKCRQIGGPRWRGLCSSERERERAKRGNISKLLLAKILFQFLQSDRAELLPGFTAAARPRVTDGGRPLETLQTVRYFARQSNCGRQTGQLGSRHEAAGPLRNYGA